MAVQAPAPHALSPSCSLLAFSNCNETRDKNMRSALVSPHPPHACAFLSTKDARNEPSSVRVLYLWQELHRYVSNQLAHGSAGVTEETVMDIHGMCQVEGTDVRHILPDLFKRNRGRPKGTKDSKPRQVPPQTLFNTCSVGRVDVI